MRALLLLAIACSACHPQGLDGGDGGAGSPQYAATLLPTAATRLQIIKADPATDQCFSLLLTSPLADTGFGIALPGGWAVENAWVTQPANACGTFVPPSGASTITQGSGAISFDPTTPCTVLLQAQLSYTSGGAAASTSLDVSNLKVMGNSACP